MPADIIVAPFSNSDIRDWPAAHFTDLIARLIASLPDTIVRIVGSAGQFWRAAEISRAFDAGRVVNECGRRTWQETVELVRSAACVVGNNSGIAHLGAHFGIPTICLFGGAHSIEEWRPRGGSVRTITFSTPCSPCHRHRADECPFGLRCLAEIASKTVAGLVIDTFDGAGHSSVSG